MNLDELSIRVIASLLIQRGLRRTSAHDRVGGLSEDRANAAGRDDDRVCGESAHLHGTQIHGAYAAADLVGIEHGREKFPVLVFLDLAFGFVAAHLLIECVKKLLTGGGSRECRTVV